MIRKMRLSAGELLGSEAHEFDHTSIFFSGSWRVTRDDEVLVFTAPAECLIEAGVDHEVLCLEKGEVWCVYSHRTPQGDIVQKFNGWMRAYQ